MALVPKHPIIDTAYLDNPHLAAWLPSLLEEKFCPKDAVDLAPSGAFIQTLNEYQRDAHYEPGLVKSIPEALINTRLGLGVTGIAKSAIGDLPAGTYFFPNFLTGDADNEELSLLFGTSSQADQLAYAQGSCDARVEGVMSRYSLLNSAEGLGDLIPYKSLIASLALTNTIADQNDYLIGKFYDGSTPRYFPISVIEFGWNGGSYQLYFESPEGNDVQYTGIFDQVQLDDNTFTSDSEYPSLEALAEDYPIRVEEASVGLSATKKHFIRVI